MAKVSDLSVFRDICLKERVKCGKIDGKDDQKNKGQPHAKVWVRLVFVFWMLEVLVSTLTSKSEGVLPFGEHCI